MVEALTKTINLPKRKAPMPTPQPPRRKRRKTRTKNGKKFTYRPATPDPTPEYISQMKKIIRLENSETNKAKKPNQYQPTNPTERKHARIYKHPHVTLTE